MTQLDVIGTGAISHTESCQSIASKTTHRSKATHTTNYNVHSKSLDNTNNVAAVKIDYKMPKPDFLKLL